MARAPAIIRHRGQVNKARTLKGETVIRQEALFVMELEAFIPCAPYDDHFIYSSDVQGSSSYMCTCGSPAVIINHESPARMFVCMAHADPEIGVHITSLANIKDFPNIAGRTIEV